MVYDALRHRYFAIGPTAFGLLSLWQPGQPANEFLAAARAQGLEVDEDELQELAHTLVSQQLAQVNGPQGVEQLKRQHERGRHGWATWLLHHYLFIRVPLWRPDHFLTRTLPWMAPCFDARLLWLVRALGGVGVMLALRQWEHFSATFLHFFSWEGLACYGLTLVLVKSAHELGHAYTARRLGCRVATIGVAFLVLVPVLYTDTTDAWRLRSARERLRIVTAGVRVELHLALLATFLWALLPEGPLRSAAFFVATTSWVTSLMVNLSPFMRFDGYFALCDVLRAGNLQPRAFAMARWQMREWLFGLDDPAPEPLPPLRRWLFIGYAYATWIYRLFIFVGIALLVYHYAFKLLGILLFAVEIGWFIVMPVQSELRAWWALRARLRLNFNLVTALAALAALVALLFVPWQPHLHLPAVLEAGGYRQVFPPERARIAALLVRQDQRVAEGELLVRLEDPTLEQALAQSRRRLELLSLRNERRAGSADELKTLQTLEQQIEEERTRLQALQRKRKLLEVRAPLAGVVSLPQPLEPGQWVEASARLMSVRGEQDARLVGFLAEADLQRVALGAEGTWMGNFGPHTPLRAALTRVDTAALATLPFAELASDHGGPIAARALSGGALRPESALYRVELTLQDDPGAPSQRIPGVLRLRGKPRSLAEEYFTAAAAALVRESSF